jgi:Uma2 family endonuclease
MDVLRSINLTCMATTTQTRRITVDEFYRMGETGEIAPDARVELIEGEVIYMSPIGPFHGGLSSSLSEYFWEFAKGRWKVRTQLPIHINETSEPQPDIALVVPASHEYKRRHPEPKDIFLVLEISDSTLRMDRGTKVRLYGRAGITEYWIVNLRQQVIEVYREPHFDGYGSATTHKAREKISPSQFPDVKIDVAEVFRRAD